MSRRKTRPANTPQAAASASTRAFLLWAGIALIVAATAIAYWPAIHGGFILDDNTLLTDNRFVRASDGLYHFWFTNEARDYWPVTNSSFWLEWRLWGMNSTGYHATNLLLHIAAALLLWAILRQLAIPGAFLATLLFAVHPVNVESVAWIAQRKNTLAMLFFLLSIWSYLRSEVGARRWYWLSLLAFLLAMLSKGSVAILPAVLLGIVWWQKGRVTVIDWVRSAPFFLVSIVLTGVNIWFQRHGSDAVIREADLPQRIAGAGAVVWFYLAKALVPIELVFVYPQWRVVVGNLLWWLPLAAAIAATALLGWRRHSRWGRPLLFAWGFFCVALAPVLGFTDVGFMRYSLVADHYQHIAIIGVVALLAAAWSDWHNRARTAALVGATVVVVVLVALTRQQSSLYADAATLYESTIAGNPECWLAYDNLGVQLKEQGKLPQAIAHYQRALELNPNDPESHNNLGVALKDQGQLPQAIEQYQLALKSRAVFPTAEFNLGNALMALGQTGEAATHFEQAVKLNPDFVEAHNNLGLVLARTGNVSKAIDCYREALRLKPTYADAWANLALAYAQSDRKGEAIEAAQQAITLARNQHLPLAEQVEAWLHSYRGSQGK